jgi:diguanylate cyclase (GGDEF)-like protein
MTLKEIADITKKLNVLFVEDDEAVKIATSKVLENMFKNVDLACDGEEGLHKFKENNYDLVVTDLEMPKLNGVDMLKQIREISPNVYIVILSAMNNSTYLIDTIRIGIDGYLFKPLMKDQFMETLESIVQKENIKHRLLHYDENLENEIKHRTKVLTNQMFTDDLTHLDNLSSLMSKIEEEDNFTSPVVILINIDSFRVFNQLYGFQAGNEILIEFASFLREFNKNKEYQLFRINADEYVLLDTVEFLDITKYEKDLDELFSKVHSHEFKIDTLEDSVDLEITAGISFSSSKPLKKANMALYEARKRGRNFIGFSYDIDYTNELQTNLFWRQEIKSAVHENRIVAFYQPIVDRDQNIVQYESLIRIKRNKDNGEAEYLAPNEFLDLSLMTKQYLVLTKFMIESTLKKMRDDNISISINLTYQDIKNNDINRILKENIKRYHLENQAEFDISNNVIFEILEHEGVDCYKMFTEFIHEFKAMGVKIALDDFGTGFSNFSQISTLAPDFIKIDGVLIENIAYDKKSYELVKAIVKFSKELGIKTIAEHVHSKEIFDIVYELGIDKFQGYYFGKPSLEIKQ